MTDTETLIARVVADGARRRAASADTAWRTMRPYERRIVREAAVMGYVLGRQDGYLDGRSGRLSFEEPRNFPGDFDIVRDVLQHCGSTEDAYPYLAEACAGRRRRITRKRMWPGEAPHAEQNGGAPPAENANRRVTP